MSSVEREVFFVIAKICLTFNTQSLGAGGGKASLPRACLQEEGDGQYTSSQWVGLEGATLSVCHKSRALAGPCLHSALAAGALVLKI